MHNRCLPGVYSSSNLRLQQWTAAPMRPWAQEMHWKKMDGWKKYTGDLDWHGGVSLSSWSTDSPKIIRSRRLAEWAAYKAGGIASHPHWHATVTGFSLLQRCAFWNMPSISTEPPGNTGLLLESKHCDRIKPISTKIWKRRYFPLNGIIGASMADESQTQPVDILSHASWNTRQ